MFARTLSISLLLINSISLSGCRKTANKQPETSCAIESKQNMLAEPDKCALLSPAQRKATPIVLGSVTREPLVSELELPGEIKPDPENLLHYAARFSGMARQSAKNIGDEVKAGDTLAIIESNENLSLYPILAGRFGTVIDKHIVPGEFVEAGKELFVIADLSAITIHLAIVGQDADVIVKGASAEVSDLTGNNRAKGMLNYISPFHHEETRSLTGRILLPNPKGVWKPGALVRVRIQHQESTPTLQVPSNAIQLVDGLPHVFIPETDVEFMAVPVVTGRKGVSRTEIIKGLSAGDTIVLSGAFELKAQMAIQAMGEAGGCSH